MVFYTMATKQKQSATVGNRLEKARQVLSTMDPEMITDISVTSVHDGMTITIIFRPCADHKEVKKEQGKWAEIANKLSDANPLRDGLGDKVRRNIKEFREHFAME